MESRLDASGNKVIAPEAKINVLTSYGYILDTTTFFPTSVVSDVTPYLIGEKLKREFQFQHKMLAIILALIFIDNQDFIEMLIMKGKIGLNFLSKLP